MTAPSGRLAGLEALREVLTDRLAADEDGKLTAPLAGQLRAVLREIDELTKGQRKGSIVDELAGRRATRKPAGSGQGSARRGGA